ncbi:antitoxin [Streptosporangium sp. NPDC000509]|uniref:antitoxin n=1 Tax=Streptosporangium sp. NPDC000509 TaxID=3366186 RepID=UPI00369C8FA8
MSILDKVKHMLGGSAKTEELAKQGIDKAEKFAKKKLGPKHAQQVDTAARKAREMADKIDEPDRTTPPGTTPAPGRTTPSGPSGRGDTASGPGTTPPPSVP